MSAATFGFAVGAGAAFAAVEAFAAAAGAACLAVSGLAGGLAGVWALAATVEAANKRIRARCLMAMFNSGWILWEVYQALP